MNVFYNELIKIYDDNNNNSNNGNNHRSCIYYSIISNNTCSNLYLYWKIQNINNNDGNQKRFGS